MTTHITVSRDKWLEARRDLLAAEKDLTRRSDEVARLRRQLPWVRVEKNYIFEGPDGPVTLADLFDGRSQLVVQQFMLAPGWEQGCKSCSYMADHTDGMTVHLAHRDVTMVAISRAPFAEIERFRRRMGWQFKWVSSYGTDFNYDFGVSFTPEEVAKGALNYNYGKWPLKGEEWPGVSVVLQGRRGRRLPHLFDLRPRRGSDDGDLPDARSHTEGPRRGGGSRHGMGASPRPLRTRTGRESLAGRPASCCAARA